MDHAEIGMNDFRLITYRPGIRFSANDARREFMLARRFLETELAKLSTAPPLSSPIMGRRFDAAALQDI